MAKKRMSEKERRRILKRMTGARQVAWIPPEKRLWVCEHGQLQQGPHDRPCYRRDPMEPVLLAEDEVAAMEIGVGIDRTFSMVG